MAVDNCWRVIGFCCLVAGSSWLVADGCWRRMPTSLLTVTECYLMAVDYWLLTFADCQPMDDEWWWFNWQAWYTLIYHSSWWKHTIRRSDMFTFRFISAEQRLATILRFQADHVCRTTSQHMTTSHCCTGVLFNATELLASILTSIRLLQALDGHTTWLVPSPTNELRYFGAQMIIFFVTGCSFWNPCWLSRGGRVFKNSVTLIKSSVALARNMIINHNDRNLGILLSNITRWNRLCAPKVL